MIYIFLQSLMDSVSIITDHSSVDLSIISNYAKIIIDNRGIFKKSNFKNSKY